jgi:hypothetical protein
MCVTIWQFAANCRRCHLFPSGYVHLSARAALYSGRAGLCGWARPPTRVFRSGTTSVHQGGHERVPTMAPRSFHGYVYFVLCCFTVNTHPVSKASRTLRWRTIHIADSSSRRERSSFHPNGLSSMILSPMSPVPSRFSTERCLTHSPQASATSEWSPRKDVRNPRDFTFGFGRRVCMGIHVAEQSLFVTAATVLHTLKIERARDAKGREIIPDVDVSGGVLSHPKPFDYAITMRENANYLVHMCEAFK